MTISTVKDLETGAEIEFDKVRLTKKMFKGYKKYNISFLLGEKEVYVLSPSIMSFVDMEMEKRIKELARRFRG